jgi:hypothetical protein
MLKLSLFSENQIAGSQVEIGLDTGFTRFNLSVNRV